MIWKSTRGWIGVDVGARAIKVAQLTTDHGRLRLSAASVSARSVEANTDSPRELADQFTTARALAQNLRGSRAAATLSMSACRVEPSSDDAPIATDQCAGRWTAGPGSDYTLSLDSRRVEDAVEGLSLAGWQCEAIDGQPLAIARALRFSPDYQREELLGALDLGAASATFIASTDGLARYVRRLHCGGMAEVCQSIAQSLSLPPKEVSKLLRRYGATASTSDGGEARVLRDPVKDAVKDAVYPLVQELKRTLEHLSGKLRAPGPKRIFVFGEGGVVPGLPAQVGDALGVTVEPWRASALERDDNLADLPDCLLGQAIALSALAWDSSREGSL